MVRQKWMGPEIVRNGSCHHEGGGNYHNPYTLWQKMKLSEGVCPSVRKAASPKLWPSRERSSERNTLSSFFTAFEAPWLPMSRTQPAEKEQGIRVTWYIEVKLMRVSDLSRDDERIYSLPPLLLLSSVRDMNAAETAIATITLLLSFHSLTSKGMQNSPRCLCLCQI